MDSYSLDAKEVLAKLNVAPSVGLTSEEAEHRLNQFGLNEIEQGRKVSPIKIFLQQFNSPLIWILIVAVIISILLKEVVDSVVIVVIIIVNAILGFIQEYKAERAIEALKKMTASHSKVIRNQQLIEIESRRVVPGDILVLETGDKIAADARIIEAHNTQTQEAVLTGESNPVQKTINTLDKHTQLADRTNMMFAGTIVTAGRTKAVVISTGMNTEFGNIAKLLQKEKQEPTPLQKRFAHLAKWMSVAAVVIIILTFGLGALRGEPLLMIFLVAVSLAVAAVPEGLPAVVTISLAIGVQRMTKRNVLIRNLSSAETLGSVSVICTDKTGTLTHNEMTVRKIWIDNTTIDVSGSGYSKSGVFSADGKEVNPKSGTLQLLLKVGMLCNDANIKEEGELRSVIGDPTEGALLVSAEKAGLNSEELEKKYPRLNEIEFTSERKFMTTMNRMDGKEYALSKGAPDVLLEKCNRIIINNKINRLTRDIKNDILKQNEKFANEALRVLGFAYKDRSEDPEKNMIFVGLQAMIDPARLEVASAIQRCKTAGIKVIMITGDHKTTAMAIAKEIGIEGHAITGAELDSFPEDKLSEHIEDIGIFARVDPEHKLKIIGALKSRNLSVAMTGDGVNDAPALKNADIGIAMGLTGTDVSKEASDMILTDDNFASIVDAVEEGRGVYDNIKKFFAFLISGNIGEIAIIFLAILFGLPLPLTATLILVINLVTDGLPAVALGADPFEPGAMQRKPRDQNEPIYSGLSPFLVWYPLFMITGVLGLFILTYFRSSNLARAQTVAFLAMALFELYQAFAARSTRYPSFKVGLFKNSYLIGAVLLSLGVCIAIIYIPALRAIFKTTALSLAEFAIIAAISSIGFIYLEIAKYFNAKREAEII
jgi:P-type Ca2+ transporter type 2C